MVTMDFTPSTVYCNLRVTFISDDGWCWALACQKLGVLTVYDLPFMYLDSVKLGSLSNYVDGLQAVSKVQDLNDLISGHVFNIRDLWIDFFLR